MAESARQEDHNGFYEIKGNPLSKVGVFPYSGAQLGLDGDDADKVFNVLRPADELSDPECIESFKLIPWIDEHTLLGAAKDGLTPAEKAGIQGVIGEDVYFDKDAGILRGNIKVFSDTLGKLIDEGKKELSCGYRCVYDMVSGIFQGEKYDAVQRSIRGNHLALVTEGRMGKEVAVLDHFTFTVDTKEAVMADEEMKKEGADAEAVTLESLAAKVDALVAFVDKLKPLEKEEHGAALDADEEEETAEDAEAEVEAEAADKCGMDSAKQIKLLQAKIKKLEKSNAVSFDSKTLLKEISQRDQLAAKLSHHIGTFDSAEMTLADVAKYGVKKLGIVCADGSEAAVLSGFLHGRTASKVVAAADSAQSSELDAYLTR